MPAQHRLVSATNPGHEPHAHRDRPPVRILVDAEDDVRCARGLVACHAPHAGIVVCEPTPGGDTRVQLGADLLVALGKRPRTVSFERLKMRAWELVAIWLRAENIKHLVILRAHLLTSQRWFDLIELSARTKIDLWLVVHTSRVPEKFDLAASVASDQRSDWETGRDELMASTSSAASHESSETSFPRVPDVDFPLFRSAARKLLPPRQFETFDSAYCAAFDAAASELAERTDRSGTGEYLIQRIIVDANSENEVITRLRAAQAAFFGGGLLIGIDLRPSTRTSLRTPTEPLLPDHVVTRLRTLASPETAAVMTLARATGLSSAQLASLRREQVVPDDRRGVSVTSAHGRFYVHPRAAAPILAQLDNMSAASPGFDNLFGRWMTNVPLSNRYYSSKAIETIRDRAADYIGVESRINTARNVPIVDVDTAFWRQ